MVKRMSLALVGVSAAIGLSASIIAAAATATFNRPSAVFPTGDLERGKKLAAPCAACHTAGAPPLGNPAFPAPKLRYQRPSTLFYALQDYRDGNRTSEFMQPIAASLSDQDMRDLAFYLSARTLRSRMPPRPNRIADTPAHQKNAAVCGMCHGETGLGEMDGYPVVGGQYRDYLVHALLAYRSGDRKNPIMRRFARSLRPDEIGLMADYFAGQTALEPIQ